MISPVRLPNTMVKKNGGKETGITHSNNPMNDERDEVEERGRIILCVKVMSSHASMPRTCTGQHIFRAWIPA